jgi:excisionase family DNA binding protein
MDTDKAMHPDPGGSSPPSPLTTAAVAAELGVSARTIRRLILSGDLPAYTIGTRTTCRHYRATPHAVRLSLQRH